ncbi:Flp family type IVb pilin [Orbus wheelerorum]|uniref:Flp family type IVb pilin n=1 Tax=Orbus wheelerorum TaxID=3074111 RepID=UPI00370D44F3
MKRSNSIRKFVQKFVKNEAGVTAIEYAIVAAGVAAVVMVIFSNTGVVAQTLTNVFNSLSTKLTAVIGA